MVSLEYLFHKSFCFGELSSTCEVFHYILKYCIVTIPQSTYVLTPSVTILKITKKITIPQSTCSVPIPPLYLQ